MDILELVDSVNEKYTKGFKSISKIEKELGYGKDTLRKKLKRNGYGYNKALNKYVLLDNTKCYKVDKVAYNPVLTEKNIGELEIKLKEFKRLSTIEQVDFINQFADGTKNLTEIGLEQFGTKHISNIINKNVAYWDDKQKRLVIIEQNQSPLSMDEILFIKQLFKKHTITQDITQVIPETENLITRSIRIDENTMDMFARYCKDNNIKQSTALRVAMENFMKK